MLRMKTSPDKAQPPPVDHNTTQLPSKLSTSPGNVPLGPVVVYIARASDLRDHNSSNTILNPVQLHKYLHERLEETFDEHNKIYSNLGLRPRQVRTIIHPASHKLPINCRITKLLAASLEEARETNTACIFVLYNWDGWTADSTTIGELCELFKDVPFSLHVYAKGHGVPPRFYEANAHKVNAYFRGRVRLHDESVTRDHDTALFIRMIEALHRFHNDYPLTVEQQRRELAKYDFRFG